MDAVSPKVAMQPIGYAAGLIGAEDQIAIVRSHPSVTANVPVITVENFILEVSQGQWYDLGVVVLNDPKNNINLQTYTQMTPVPSHIVESAKQATPKDYPLISTGVAVSVGSLIAENLQVRFSNFLSFTSLNKIRIFILISLSGITKRLARIVNWSFTARYYLSCCAIFGWYIR